MSKDYVVRLRFIKRAKALGFILNENKELLTLRHDPHTTRADIKERTIAKIVDVSRKIHTIWTESKRPRNTWRPSVTVMVHSADVP